MRIVNIDRQQFESVHQKNEPEAIPMIFEAAGR